MQVLLLTMVSQLPIGIVEYFAGISSPLINWAVRLYDLDPSTESGIHRIALAADEGHWSWIEAKAILSNLYLWVENDPILALEHAKDLANNFPNKPEPPVIPIFFNAITVKLFYK